MSESPTPRIFHTTRWSMVHAAAGASTEQRAEALEWLCERYWMPLYAYLRRRGYADHDAQDLTQAFFVACLEKGFLEDVHAEKGRFRSFLLVAIQRFATNEYHRQRAQKRGGALRCWSFDFASAESWYQFEPVDRMTPEAVFERRWALSVLENVMAQLETRFAAQDKQALFTVLKPHLVADRDRLPYEQIATELNCSVSAVKSTMHRLRGWYRQILRNEIAQTVSPEDVDDELQRLVTTLGEF